jgi:membrane-associated phospholipid phosphatase
VACAETIGTIQKWGKYPNLGTPLKEGTIPRFLAGGQEMNQSCKLVRRKRQIFPEPTLDSPRNSIRILFVAVLIIGTGPVADYNGGTVRAAGGIETAGTVIQVVLPAVGGVITLLRIDSRGFWQLVETVGVTTAVTSVLKYTINETRPNGGHYSFPSGHTSLSFCSAEFLRRRYGWKWGLPAYAAAVFVGYSRVEAKQHYTHDVLAGSAIGFLCSALFVDRYAGFRVGLDFHGKTGMVSLSCRW